MIKRVSLARRLPGLTRAEFVDHWTGPHTEIVRELPGLRGMRLGIVEPPWAPDHVQWDGVGELWFDTIEDARAAFAAEPHARKLAADRPRFIGDVQACFVYEHTVIAPPRAR